MTSDLRLDLTRSWPASGNSTHGGKREGAGRKPAIHGIKKTHVFTEHHLALIAQWQQAHGVSASESVRQMIERAAEKEGSTHAST